MATREVVFAKLTGSVAWSRGRTHLSKGKAYDANAPIVRERPDLFEGHPSAPEQERVARSEAPVVESATRAPGEKRRTQRPRKSA